ncbi:MAG: SDR family NAD(P)-dependent oxidoreductase [Bacilli bacterium]|nr:SDR family NAD(P)-dependent oxidoreductase [Bacilli bacterium]
MLKQSKWLDKKIPSLEGKVFLLTGCSSGLGLEALKSLLYKGAEVIGCVRNLKKMEALFEGIKKELPSSKATFMVYDQADPSSCLALAESLKDKKIDSIILNAGIYYPAKGAVSNDGTSLTDQVNIVGQYHLFEAFRKTHPTSHYVFVTSPYHIKPKKGGYVARLYKYQPKRGKDYAISKEYARDLYCYAKKLGLSCSITHPGVSGTAIFDGFPPAIRRTGHAVLTALTHKPWKASLGEVLCAANPGKDYFAVPRGPFHISGYPKVIKSPKGPNYPVEIK